jgi:hypothetical protein
MQQRLQNTERYRETRRWAFLLLHTQRMQNSPKFISTTTVRTGKHNLASWYFIKLTDCDKGEAEKIWERRMCDIPRKWQQEARRKCTMRIFVAYVYQIPLVSRDSSVGIANIYRLDDRGVGFQVPVGSRIFSSPRCPDRLWSPPNLLSNGYRRLFLRR